ncbi:9000_t:CDS:1 [Paraglomus occultum]|uniref:9000_t:CDS:1 n=1 Tax=Paraglomus occultum TaxID=144539 RepID=A0A9N9G9T1_9GLOM|nr:9000_t:CDS:1 [Paraglomus occultum]
MMIKNVTNSFKKIRTGKRPSRLSYVKSIRLLEDDTDPNNRALGDGLDVISSMHYGR